MMNLKLWNKGLDEPPTLKNVIKTGAIIFESPIKLMLYQDFRSGIVPHNFSASGAFF